MAESYDRDSVFRYFRKPQITACLEFNQVLERIVYLHWLFLLQHLLQLLSATCIGCEAWSQTLGCRGDSNRTGRPQELSLKPAELSAVDGLEVAW